MEISDEIYDKAIILNGFSVQIRYPDNTLFLSKHELELSIVISDEFRALAIQTIKIVE